jgi:hypothetical protein
MAIVVSHNPGFPIHLLFETTNLKQVWVILIQLNSYCVNTGLTKIETIKNCN